MYSPDPEQNKENPFTPSLRSLDEQFIYRFARLETIVEEGFRTLREDFASHREEAVEIKVRVTALEKWKDAMIVRLTIVSGAIVVFWTVFAPSIRDTLGVGN